MSKQQKIVYCRTAPSLGTFEATPSAAWGTPEYHWPLHRKEACVWTGLYDARDFLSLFLHAGHRFIFWCGMDIVNRKANFALGDGKLKTISRLFSSLPRFLDRWIARHCESWCENSTEADALHSLGIPVAGICPSFLGDVNSYKVTYKFDKTAAAYVSAGQGRGAEYGFGILERVAARLPWMVFYLYGDDSWPESELTNVINRGRVPKKVFNKETATMQAALSLNDFCGFSEVVARGILQGHYAVSKVPHPLIPSFQDELELVTTLNRLSKMKEPNLEARLWYKKNLNQFPWTAGFDAKKPANSSSLN